MKKNDARHHSTQIALHSVRNMLGEQSQITLFSEHDKDFSSKFGVHLTGTIDRFGIDLTDMQFRIVEGILRGLSETSYKGNVEADNTTTIAEEKYYGKIPDSYKYIHEIPKLRATQTQILEWSGINQSSIACWARAVEAINEIAIKQYCFYYDRLAFNEQGEPIRDKSGRWQKEEVIVVDTLFTIKEVRGEEGGTLKYYEIIPSSIFLDQRESYFMLVPFNWREEVKQLVGNKKASSYTFRFLLFLRYQYELKRRSKRDQVPYKIKWNSEEIAVAIKMPESIYKRKKKRMNSILEDAYTVAKRLGYLKEFERNGCLDVLTLNEDKYFNPQDVYLKKAIEGMSESAEFSSSAIKLFDFFHSQRKTLDEKHVAPIDKIRFQQISAFVSLLKERQFADIEKIIVWACKTPFWCTRLSSPESLYKNFGEALSEFSVQPSKECQIKSNKEFARFCEKTVIRSNVSSFKVEVLNEYVEVGNGVQQPFCVSYDEKNFKDKLIASIEKWGIKITT